MCADDWLISFDTNVALVLNCEGSAMVSHIVYYDVNMVRL